MRKHIQGIILFVSVLCMIAYAARGSHIYGGNMSLQATSTPGFYKLSLTLFFDKRNADPSNGYDSPTVYIFRKKDNIRVRSVFLPQEEQRDLFKNTPACTNLLPLDLLRIRYSATINLSPSEYNEAQGYYVIWERCCRNGDIVNIQNARSTGMAFRMDFPAVVQKGIGFQDSSPDFSIPPADYVCINRPFKASFKATDTDGDQLQYELVDPLAGYTSEYPETNRIGSGLSRASYPSVTWNSGFSATRAIPGSPGLQINPTTGELTVTASQPGLYTFAVLVREFRNGKEIGQVRREFQLPVVDCKLNQTIPTPPVIMANGQPVGTTVQHCESTALTLAIELETDYEYQWRRDGQDLDGETKATLAVSEAGIYTVQKKFLRNCGRDTVSQALNVFCQVQLFTPTAFTPNGDGINDSWVIYLSEPVPDMEVTVYDRWGMAVFYSKGYKAWDGFHNDQKVPSGSYSYLIKLPNQPPYRGSVQVLY